MFIFRTEDDEQIDVVISNNEKNINIIDEEGVVAGMDMIEIHDEIIQEEKKLEDEIQLLKGSKQFTYNTLSAATSEEDRSSHLIIQRPFGTNPSMCKVVLLRGIIEGIWLLQLLLHSKYITIRRCNNVTIIISNPNNILGTFNIGGRDKVTATGCFGMQYCWRYLDISALIFVWL